MLKSVQPRIAVLISAASGTAFKKKNPQSLSFSYFWLVFVCLFFKLFVKCCADLMNVRKDLYQQRSGTVTRNVRTEAV